MKKTKPGFDGDVFHGKVIESDVPEGEVDVKHRRVVGSSISNLRWGVDLKRDDESKGETSVGDTGVADFATHGCTKISVTDIPDFRRDLFIEIQKQRGRELPGFTNFRPIRSLMKQYISRWKDPAESFRVKMRGVFHLTASHLLKKNVGRRVHDPSLVATLFDALEDHMEVVDRAAVSRLGDIFEQEILFPMTQESDFLDAINRHRDATLLEKLNSIEVSSKAIQSTTYANAVEEKLKSDFGAKSEHSQEVTDTLIVTKVYWNVAMKRFVDVIGMSDSEVQALFQEPPSVIAKRQELTKKIHRLKEARKLVNSGSLTRIEY